MLIPPPLKQNDIIGIVCPSGAMPEEKAKACIKTLKRWGYQVKTGDTLGAHFHYFSGTDEDRLRDLQQMINAPEIKAILCGRGGYGLSRIIDNIDFLPLKENPKWIIGYSDITLLHCHLQQKIKIASLHSPMAGAFNDPLGNEYTELLSAILAGKKSAYRVPSHPFNKPGKAQGELAGGNLTLLAHTIGSVSEPDLKGKLLFIEDIGEYLYSADRMLQQIRRAGWFDQIAGLLIGGFTDMKDTTTPFGETIYEIINDVIPNYKIPVGFNFPVGHQPNNYPLKCGVTHELTIDSGGIELKEI